MSRETVEQRVARLARQREQRRARINRQNQEARQAQIDASRSAVNPDRPLLEQASILTKLINFHFKLATLEFRTCTSCLEHFPNLTMAAHSTECSRCSRDTQIPKLYTSVNNMDPGPVLPQLQVTDIFMCITYTHLNTDLSHLMTCASFGIHFIGSHPSGGDAGVCGDAYYIHLPITTCSVRVHRPRHQSTSGRGDFCSLTP